MSKVIDLTGQKFNRLTVLSDAGKTKFGRGWLCLCDCGNTTVIAGGGLQSGNNKSCGCLNNGPNARTHGQTNTPTYRSWNAMKYRCSSPNCEQYSDYGGRGITVCDRWQRFEHFLADMGEKPTPKHTIERIDNNKGYSPDNCRWATRTEQMNNRRNVRNLTWNGKTQSLAMWARELGVKRDRLRQRLNSGWSVERILTTPNLHSHYASRIK